MNIEELNHIDRLAAAFGNRYAVASFIAKRARYLSATLSYSIFDSQAVSWAISGVKPQKVVTPPTSLNWRSDPITLVLDLVDDVQIKECVIRSIRQSVSQLVDSGKPSTTFHTDKNTEYTSKFLSMYILNHSLRMDELVFEYENVDDPYNQARIRILCRLIWDKFECNT